MASPELQMVLEMLSANPLLGERPAEEMRAGLEAMAGGFALDPDVRVAPTRAAGMAAEWIATPGASADQRGGEQAGHVPGHPHLLRGAVGRRRVELGLRRRVGTGRCVQLLR